MGILSALVASTLTAASIIGQINADLPNLEPTTDLSAVRVIWCHNPDKADPNMGWQGSGSVIADGIVLTALHVASGDHCIDEATGKPLRLYAKDTNHDMALMTGETPAVPYMKYSCEPYKKGKPYLAYGISSYLRPNYLFRQNLMIFTGKHEDITMDTGTTQKRMAVFDGPSVPGMSGGPYTDIYGVQHGIVNAGEHDVAGIPTRVSYSYELHDSPLLCKH